MGSNENNPLLLIEERRKNPTKTWRSLLPTWDASGAATLKGFAAAFSMKQKCSQDTFESFSPPLSASSPHVSFTPSPQSQEVKEISPEV